MRDQCVKGPSFAQLRPDKEKDTAEAYRAVGSFPVFPDLVERLTTARAQPDPEGVIPYVMAAAASYAYSGWSRKGDPETVAAIMARMGLEENRCRVFEQRVDAMYIASGAYLIQDRDRRIAILCYRGTPPDDLIAVLADADVTVDRISVELDGEKHDVHGGFYRNMRATRYLVIEALERAIEGKSILPGDEPDTRNGLEALYITGHSMGGCMAALMAVVLACEPRYQNIADKLRGVYTFGQPMIGGLRFAQACEEKANAEGVRILRDRVIRYIYDRDFAPHFPARPLGEFAPFGREFHYRKPLSTLDWAFSLVGEGLDAAVSVPGEVLELIHELPELTRTGLTRPHQLPVGDLGQAGRAAAEGLWRTIRPPMAGPQGWYERFGDARSRQMRNLAGLTVVAPLAYLAGRLALTRTVPFKYSWGDHEPNHYLSTLAPEGVLSEFGDVR